MGLADAPVRLAAETSLRDILDSLKREKFDLVVIDSIQTMWSDAHEAAPGSVTQVRAAAGELVRLAKKQSVAMILVGHVTKDGAIAGPRVVEHMVDAVLTFEGERGYPFRILRGTKNRFGATDEIGVFEMGDAGLGEVRNPSALFLDTSGERAAGAAVFAGIEGSRPVLVVLEARCGLSLGDRDVYLNVAGGLRVTEPAADLAAAAALASSALDEALPQDCVVFGEIGLSGDIRSVSRMDSRMKEAAKLGFNRVLGPQGLDGGGAMKAIGATRLADAIRRIGECQWE
jgi:DNA repair protein RadA/Sms